MSDQVMAAVVSLVARNLTDDEMIALNLAMQLDSNPTHVMGYEKAKPLFTENNGTKAHDEAKRIFYALLMKRIGK